jgi:decaprenyl-phosphate phosphoribosyltransferase
MPEGEATVPGMGALTQDPALAPSAPGATERTSSPDGLSSAGPGRGVLRAALVTLRPRQWIKNALVVAAAGAAGALTHDDVPVRVGLAFVAFCMLASGIYAINDVRDAEEDRLHPRKRYRPVAAGELDAVAAIGLGVGLMVAGIVLCALIQPPLAVIGAGYLALTLSYTVVWRHLLVFDIVAIAGGFVLRAVAGGVAPPVTLSSWFILVVSAAAVFVAAGKRHAELRRTTLAAVTVGRRRVLEGYTELRLRVILIISAGLAVFSYSVWAFELPSVHGVPWRPLTIIPFVVCLARYGALIGTGSGESPEDLLIADRVLQFAGGIWLVLFALGVHAAS